MEKNRSAKTLFKILFPVVKEAGIVARMLQESIQNDGKEVLHEEGESELHKAMREAKTLADEIIQEMLLQALYVYRDVFTIDVEENTPSIHEFKRTDYEYTVVIDPIDGTLNYLEQGDAYSICITLFHKHVVLLTIVYFPKRNRMFTYIENEPVLVYEEASKKEMEDGVAFTCTPLKERPNIMYMNRRVPHDYIQQLEAQGIVVVNENSDGMCCPDALLACMKGEALGYLSKTANTRDIMMGILLTKCNRGSVHSFEGEDVVWANHGRQQELLFSIYDTASLWKK